MKTKARIMVRWLFEPSVWVTLIVSAASFGALAFLFAAKPTESILTYLFYGLSAYSLTLLTVAASRGLRRSMQSQWIQGLLNSTWGIRYRSDSAFRARLALYRGMIANLLYMVFRLTVGIQEASIWSLSIAAYYLALGMLRVYLIVCEHRPNWCGEYRCYRMTAWLLLLLNIPMGGMIYLMIWTDSGFSYSGYLVYASALYTFYSMTMAMIHLVKYGKLGSPILSAAQKVNFTAAMMSVLSLQTALLSQFSERGEDYRRMMNTLTGSAVWSGVIALAVYMLWRSMGWRRRQENDEPK